MTFLKQYGEQRAGTNYLKRLLEINFDNLMVFGSVLGWKHGMYQLKNGYDSPSAENHEDWVRQKKKAGKIYSVDDHPLPYSESFLLEAAASVNYLISWKPMLPWLVSLKRFRFPRNAYDPSGVQRLFQQYIENYKTWLKLPRALVIGHDVLINEAMCIRLMDDLKERFHLQPKRPSYTIERNIVLASTDHGILMTDAPFDRDYYAGRRYLDELPGWARELSEDDRFCTRFIEDAAWRPS